MLRATKFLPSPKVSSPIWICMSLSLSDKDWNICRTCMKQAGSLIPLCFNSSCVCQPISQCAQSFYKTAEDSQFDQVSQCSATLQGFWVLAYNALTSTPATQLVCCSRCYWLYCQVEAPQRKIQSSSCHQVLKHNTNFD